MSAFYGGDIASLFAQALRRLLANATACPLTMATTGLNIVPATGGLCNAVRVDSGVTRGPTQVRWETGVRGQVPLRENHEALMVACS